MAFDGVVSKSGPSLDTVRALHQTVVALRAALEQSRSEILELKAKAWPATDVQDTLKSLSIENHVLRRTILDKPTVLQSNEDDITEAHREIEHNTDNRVELEIGKVGDKFEDKDGDIRKADDTLNNGDATTIDVEINETSDRVHENSNDLSTFDNTDDKIGETQTNESQQLKKQVKILSPKHNRKSRSTLEAVISIKTETFSARKISKSLESLTIINTPVSPRGSRKLTVSKTLSYSHIDYSKAGNSQIMDNQRKEDQQPATSRSGNSYVEQCTQSPQEDDQDQEVDDIELIFTTDEMKETDLKEHLVSIDADAGESGAESSNLLRCPGSDLDQLDVSDRELDDDVFNDGNYEGDMRDSAELQVPGCKKGTLSQMYSSKSDNSINNDEKSLKSCCSYQDSSFENKSLEKDESFDRFEERVRIVETDISKCGIQDVEYSTFRRNTCPNPLQYRPLVHREALCKGLNVRKSRPILVHSNAIRRESGAQTDISAIPNAAWRSESSLGNKAKVSEHFTTLPSKFPLPGSRLRLSEKTVEARRVLLSDIGFTSMVPELSRSADHLCPGNLRPAPVTSYGQFLRTPDLYSPGYALSTSQKFTWTATTATPSDGSHSRYSSMYPLSPPASGPARRCSAPVSPSRRAALRQTPSKVRFANGSLPELRGDWTLTVDSGDSTDSLVEEAENYLRRSIDCIVSGRDVLNYCDGKKTVPRRASAPEPTADNIPPQGWQPFLPRVPRDLKLDHWVKVITPEGRVRGGRVRYIGPVALQQDHFVGVQLSTPDGPTDGTIGTKRYFQCEPFHGIFVPFKKVIMGWRP